MQKIKRMMMYGLSTIEKPLTNDKKSRRGVAGKVENKNEDFVSTKWKYPKVIIKIIFIAFLILYYRNFLHWFSNPRSKNGYQYTQLV